MLHKAGGGDPSGELPPPPPPPPQGEMDGKLEFPSGEKLQSANCKLTEENDTNSQQSADDSSTDHLQDQQRIDQQRIAHPMMSGARPNFLSTATSDPTPQPKAGSVSPAKSDSVPPPIEAWQQKKESESYNVVVLYRLRDNIAVIATLIATFTYAAGVNPPGGVHQDGPLMGTSIAAKRAAFTVFFVCNNMALLASLSVVVFLLSMDIISYKKDVLGRMMKIAHTALWAAIFFMAEAYVAASMVMMRPPTGIKGIDWITALVLSIFGGLFVTMFVAVVIMLVRRRLVVKKESSKPSGETNQNPEVQPHYNLMIPYHYQMARPPYDRPIAAAPAYYFDDENPNACSLM